MTAGKLKRHSESNSGVMVPTRLAYLADCLRLLASAQAERLYLDSAAAQSIAVGGTRGFWRRAMASWQFALAMPMLPSIESA